MGGVYDALFIVKEGQERNIDGVYRAREREYVKSLHYDLDGYIMSTNLWESVQFNREEIFK